MTTIDVQAHCYDRAHPGRPSAASLAGPPEVTPPDTLKAQPNPDTQLVIDHLGLEQPMKPPAPAKPWHELPKLLALAAHKNIAVKISGACTLSHEKFPYKDIWDPLGRIFDAFSLNRCMW